MMTMITEIQETIGRMRESDRSMSESFALGDRLIEQVEELMAHLTNEQRAWLEGRTPSKLVVRGKVELPGHLTLDTLHGVMDVLTGFAYPKLNEERTAIVVDVEIDSAGMFAPDGESALILKVAQDSGLRLDADDAQVVLEALDRIREMQAEVKSYGLDLVFA